MWGLYSLLKVDKTMFLVSFSFAVAGLVCLHKARLKYLEYWKFRKLPELWKKLRTSYEKGDFGAIKAVIPKIRKIEDDPVLMLIEAEMHLFGKTVFQSYFKAIELYEKVSTIKLPEKTKWEKNPYTKKYAEKTKKARKKKKKEDYLKRVKSTAVKIWNENNLSHIKERYHRIVHTDEPIEVKEA
jgi:hypothetical protein